MPAVKTPAVSAPKSRTMGALIDAMFELREKKRALDTQVKELEAQYIALEDELLVKLDAEGTDKAAGKKATVSVTSSVVGNVTDWEKFGAFVIKNKYLHLFQRRLSDPAVRELFEMKGKIPGCEPFTKRRVNLRVS